MHRFVWNSLCAFSPFCRTKVWLVFTSTSKDRNSWIVATLAHTVMLSFFRRPPPCPGLKALNSQRHFYGLVNKQLPDTFTLLLPVLQADSQWIPFQQASYWTWCQINWPAHSVRLTAANELSPTAARLLGPMKSSAPTPSGSQTLCRDPFVGCGHIFEHKCLRGCKLIYELVVLLF